ncbi:MAG: transposase [Candidatus Acidiferrales bacterium]
MRKRPVPLHRYTDEVDTKMPRKGHTEEQTQAVRQAEGEEQVGDVYRKLGISEQTFYAWNGEYPGIVSSELSELQKLRKENAKPKRLVADSVAGAFPHERIGVGPRPEDESPWKETQAAPRFAGKT